MKIVFTILLISHGLIHLLGHYNAYKPGKIDGMTMPVSRFYGFIWLAAAVLTVTSAILLLFNQVSWWLLGCLSLLLSQFLIVRFWQDARYGTIGNVILFFGLIVGYGSWSFHREYKADYNEGLKRTESISNQLVSESDLASLPKAVKKYLKYTGVVGQPRVKNVKVKLKAQMRNEGEDWFSMRSEQYNFFDQYERLFFLRAKVKGLPVTGYHKYKDDQAGMVIKALSFWPIIEEHGPEMFVAETVTLFNDMCIMAPATLISKDITWQEVNDTTVIGGFTNGSTTISATLEFNKLGQLVNFISDDRYNLDRKRNIRFSTPISDYKERNGLTLATFGEAIWHNPEGAFVYGKFKIQSVRYNLTPGKLP